MDNLRGKLWLKAVSLVVAGVFLFSQVSIALASDGLPYNNGDTKDYIPVGAPSFKPVEQMITPSSGRTDFHDDAGNVVATLVENGNTGTVEYSNGDVRHISYGSDKSVTGISDSNGYNWSSEPNAYDAYYQALADSLNAYYKAYTDSVKAYNDSVKAYNDSLNKPYDSRTPEEIDLQIEQEKAATQPAAEPATKPNDVWADPLAAKPEVPVTEPAPKPNDIWADPLAAKPEPQPSHPFSLYDVPAPAPAAKAPETDTVVPPATVQSKYEKSAGGILPLRNGDYIGIFKDQSAIFYYQQGLKRYGNDSGDWLQVVDDATVEKTKEVKRSNSISITEANKLFRKNGRDYISFVSAVRSGEEKLTGGLITTNNVDYFRIGESESGEKDIYYKRSAGKWLGIVPDADLEYTGLMSKTELYNRLSEEGSSDTATIIHIYFPL